MNNDKNSSNLPDKILVANDGSSTNMKPEGDSLFLNKKQEHIKNSRPKRLLIGSIAYIVFIFAVLLVSIGFFRYVEQESIFAIFLTQRDKMMTQDNWNGKDWASPTPGGNSALDSSKRAVIRENERLLVPFFYVGEQFGTLNFTGIDHIVPVIQGDSEAEFKLGGGHLGASYFPGQDGNIVIGGHRTTHFRKLEYVKVGETIQFDAVYGTFIYRIDEIKIIKGGDNSIAAATNKEQLTIYTCYPFTYFGNAPSRYVLICSLTESEVFR